MEKNWISYPEIKPKPPEIECDVVIIGGGPNGLTAGAYLGKAGQKVVIVDRRNELGGGIATEEATCIGGYRHNVHAVYFMMVDYAPVYPDLKLEQYDLKHVYPELQFCMPFKDGSSLCIHSDVERTIKSIEKFSKKDAKAYQELFTKAKEFVENIIAPGTYVQPSPALESVVKMQQTELGRELMEFSEKTPLSVVDELFEHEKVKALMLYILCMWGLDPTQSGVGYLIPLYINRSANYRLVVNGSHSLPQALYKVILENNGKILSPYHVSRIIMEGKEAKGVELENGPTIKAKAVLSTLDTHQTFLQMVGEENLESDFAESVKVWMWEHWSLMGVHMALSEAPDFKVAKKDASLNKSFIYVLGYETPRDFLDHYDAIERGEADGNIGFNCCFPTVHDPSQAPPGKHTGLISVMAPYELKEGKEKWYDINFREEQIKKSIGILREYAPNLTDEKIRGTYISTPLDVENKYLDM
ncbi:MAG: NAD(P)/FAD-dependent oxidoreductase, partial [Thermodesulfobacteriota bacterium]|nr:NAD(P)/FAD-dependent oxidoreductase [Thermodesulfobacteriota bacterium]